MASREKKVTAADIAALCHVSPATVSLILQEKNLGSFQQETIERVREACRATGYVPRSYTHKTAGTGRDLVLVMANRLSNPFHTGLIMYMEQLAREHQLTLLECNTLFDPRQEEHYLKTALGLNALGVIYLYSPKNIAAVSKYSRLLPMIAIGDNANELPIDFVELNALKAGSIAAEHLLALGHRRFAFMVDSLDLNYSRRARYTGIEKALSAFSAAGGEKDLEYRLYTLEPPDRPDFRQKDYDYDLGCALCEKMLADGYAATAIFALNDTQAFGIIDALIGHGLNVPEDVSVIGFNNQVTAGLTRTPLTTIDVHQELLARSAMDTLLRRIQPDNYSNDAFISVQCQPKLIVRSSTAPVKK